MHRSPGASAATTVAAREGGCIAGQNAPVFGGISGDFEHIAPNIR